MENNIGTTIKNKRH